MMDRWNWGGNHLNNDGEEMEKMNKGRQTLGGLVGVGKEHRRCVLPEMGKFSIHIIAVGAVGG